MDKLIHMLVAGAFVLSCASQQTIQSELEKEIREYRDLTDKLNYTVEKRQPEPADFCEGIGVGQLCEITEYNGFLNDSRFKEDGILHELMGEWQNLESSQAARGMLNLASLETFAQFPIRQFLDHVDPQRQKSVIEVLYPAAGDHVAPLQLIPLLHNNHPLLQSVRFTYTEVPDEAELYFRKQLQMLQNHGFITNIQEQRQEHVDLPLGEYAQSVQINGWLSVTQPPHTTAFDFDVIVGAERLSATVTYAVNMSGDKFFRKEDADKADLMILHASGVPDREVKSGLIIPGKPKAILQGAFFYGEPPGTVLDDRGQYSKQFCMMQTDYLVSCPALYFVGN